MFRNAKYGLRGCVLLLVLAICAPLNAAPLLWEVRGKDPQAAPIYLMGSVHFGTKEMIADIPAATTSAFEGSKALAVELDPTAVDPMTQMQSIMKHSSLPAGQTLQAYLGEPVWQRFTALCQELGVSAQAFQAVRPWLASIQLTALQLRRLGYSESSGIDLHFLTLAKKAGKPVLELESLEQQLSIFGNLDADLEKRFFSQSLEETQRGSEYIGEMFAPGAVGMRQLYRK